MYLYCNKTDLIRTFGEMEINHIAADDDNAIEKAIADASAEMDLYLASRYKLPLSKGFAVLNRIACDMARYYLYNSLDTESTVYIRYQQRLKQLQGIANGTLALTNEETGDKPSGEAVVFVDVGSKVFHR
ncbi:gp436 family protein [Actinobacillus delphinicola]|uniref:Mu-like prophage protein gp36 n=1 Tax=Actinobacillus delphinicola TaxID=51161 RepID=A0A448TUZ0_9PAST|nr:DUF1320 domain-containing protein [Actinobacillus delphinicola]VEJ09745.1 Mu-like prophage protein gp36 [Actinobacillus delphinicola]